MVIRDTVCKRDYFDRAQTITTTPAGEFGWTKAVTESTAQSTMLCISGRGLKTTLGAANESKNLSCCQNDVLPYQLNKIQQVRFVAKVSGVDSATTLTFGVASARNDDPDATSVNAQFKIAGSDSTSNVVVETDDGTTDLDDKATGATLGSTEKEFIIDFSNGLSDVRFYIDGARVAASTTFTLAAASSSQNVQVLCQLQKASGTGVASVTLKLVEVIYNIADGA